jgi:O-methyltransferase involved in polyketide biosynthesis
MTTDTILFSDSISQTLFIPLWAKAQETRRADGILRDAVAERVVSLLPKRVFDFPKKKPMMVGSVVRSRYFDDVTREALSRGGDPVLVHLGCGLDDRFGRTDAGGGTQVNIDLPDVMLLRARLMPSRSNRNIDWSGSLLETDWMDRLLDYWPKAAFTFFMEGVLMYFSEDDVRRLFVDLAERFPRAGLHFDVCDSRMCRLVGNQRAIRQANATFKWGMDDDRQLEKWHSRLEYRNTRYYFEMYRKRWGLLSLMRFVPFFGRGSRMLAYRIAEE